MKNQFIIKILKYKQFEKNISFSQKNKFNKWVVKTVQQLLPINMYLRAFLKSQCIYII